MRRREEGFTLVELLMVVAVIGILASIAVMSVLRARLAANEASAIGSLRTVTSGQISYSAACGAGNYATSLVTLGPFPPMSPEPFLPPDLTAGVMVAKSGYHLSLEPSSAAVAAITDCNGIGTHTGYFVRAEPIMYGTSGTRSFATISPSHTIWYVHAALSPAEPFAAPAQMIQ